MQENDLLVIGDMVLDVYMQIPLTALRAGDVVASSSYELMPGGACTVAVSASRMGIRCAILDTVGYDAEGEMLINEMKEEGVNISFVRRSRECSTSRCIILLMNKRHTFLGYECGIDHIEHINKVDLSLSRMIYFDGYLLRNRMSRERLRGAIKDNDVKVAFDPGPFVAKIPLYFFRRADVLLLNEEEWKAMKSRVHVSPELLVIKRGPRGASAFLNEKRMDVPGVPLQTISNTVGAGDVFDGVFLSCLLNGAGVQTALNYANMAAARRVKYGGRKGLPLKRIPRSPR